MLRKYAAIDADFFIHCVNHQATKVKDGSLFLKIVNDMDCIPIMHQYVAEQEIISAPAKNVLAMLRANGKIKIFDYGDYLPDEKREDYVRAFKQAFFHINGRRFPISFDIFQYRQAKESLGELRTFLMAFWLNGTTLEGQKATVELLLSNDHGTKELLTTGIIPKNQTLSVYNIEETLTNIGNQLAHSTQWSDIKILAKETTHVANRLRLLFRQSE